jgi:hypothetical protein
VQEILIKLESSGKNPGDHSSNITKLLNIEKTNFVSSSSPFPRLNGELKHWRFLTRRRRPDVDFTSGECVLNLCFAVATRRQREMSCFAVVSKTWFKQVA